MARADNIDYLMIVGSSWKRYSEIEYIFSFVYLVTIYCDVIGYEMSRSQDSSRSASTIQTLAIKIDIAAIMYSPVDKRFNMNVL